MTFLWGLHNVMLAFAWFSDCFRASFPMLSYEGYLAVSYDNNLEYPFVEQGLCVLFSLLYVLEPWVQDAETLYYFCGWNPKYRAQSPSTTMFLSSLFACIVTILMALCPCYCCEITTNEGCLAKNFKSLLSCEIPIFILILQSVC